MHRLPPPRCRRAFTLLELLVVLVLLGMSAAFVAPVLTRPIDRSGSVSAIERARGVAVRRGETMRFQFDADGRWTVRATADTSNAILLSGTDADPGATEGARSLMISPLGVCLPESQSGAGAAAWDPTRCTVARR